MAIRKDRTELLVGLFVFFGLAFMGTLIVQFGRFSDRWKDHYQIEVQFPDASGIRQSSPVNLAGQKIGYVAEEPDLNEDFTGVTVLLNIYQDQKIPVGSAFSIGTSGLMGDTYVKINMPEDPKPEYIESGTSVSGADVAGLDALQDNASIILEEIRVAVVDLQKVFDKIENGILADENIENVQDILADFRKTSENISEATGKIDPLINEAKTTVAEAKKAMTKAGEAMDRAREVIGKAEPAMENLEPTVAELKSTLENANKAITKISEGNGVFAALISDSSLRKDLQSFVDKLERFGILGYPKEKKPSSGLRLFGR